MTYPTSNPDRWRAVAVHIPVYAHTLLALDDDGVAAAALSARGTARRIVVLEPDTARAAAFRDRFDRVVSSLRGLTEPVDLAVIFAETDDAWNALPSTLASVLPVLPPFGRIILVASGERDVQQPIRDLPLVAATLSMQADPSIRFLIPRAYDRLQHARQLADAGRPDWALQVLSECEADTEAAELQRLKAMHRYLDAWDVSCDDAERMRRFFLSLTLFAKITDKEPRCAEAFEHQAAFWARIGDAGMADRPRRTIAQAEGRWPDAPPRVELAPIPEPDAPEYDPSYTPRVLMVLEPEPDYGSDVLYDGLADVLGDENVVEYPWKPTLHGEPAHSRTRYPCLFNRAGRPMALPDLLAQLQAGRFDAVLYCAHNNAMPSGELHAITQAASPAPVFIIDQGDSPVDARAVTAALLGVAPTVPYFKREMVQCVDYGSDAYPLPFAYPSAPLVVQWAERVVPVFWAGHRAFGLRRLYLDHLEGRLGNPFEDELDQDAYVRQLANARIGLSFFGLGFDTVRYWELAAHGCMLVSERLPIRVPHNFVDGESAVFFDDLEELERRLVYYLDRPGEAEAIARAGRTHFERYHTGAARARQLLARMHPLTAAFRNLKD